MSSLDFKQHLAGRLGYKAVPIKEPVDKCKGCAADANQRLCWELPQCIDKLDGEFHEFIFVEKDWEDIPQEHQETKSP